MKPKTVDRSGVYRLRLTALNCLLVCALISSAGCGRRSDTAGDDAIKGPATAEQAARVLDLTTFPLMEGAPAVQQRTVANLSYPVATNVKAAFEFQKKKLAEKGWKELPNTSVTDQSGSGMFARRGFIVSVSIFPSGEPGKVLVTLHNFGNVSLAKLPVPRDTKPVYVGDATAMYVTGASVESTAAAMSKLIIAEGWQPYGSAGDSSYFKQNAIRLGITVSSAPAQGGKTMISFASELMSADLPAPEKAEELQYSDSTKELSFATTADKNAVVDYYKKTLDRTGWKSTLDATVKIDDNDTMIFRNPAKDMLTLSMPPASNGKIRVSLQHQSAAEIAELDRLIKAQGPALRKKAEEREAKEAAEFAEAHKPLPKVAVSLPADAADLEQTKDQIKFKVGNGKAKAIAETWRRQFRDAGWKENIATLEAMAGAISLSKEKQSLTINYSDTGMMPAEINISAMGAELEAASGDK
jgi:hypothetical protein